VLSMAAKAMGLAKGDDDDIGENSADFVSVMLKLIVEF
jgi:hypothetical protein